AAERARGAHAVGQAGRPPCGEAARGPAARRGDGREAAVGIRRPGPADDLEQRQVLVAVRIEEALAEVDAALAGERARRHRLPAAVDRGPEVAPGAASVLHLEPRAEDVR